MSSCSGFLGSGLKPLLKAVMLVLILLQLEFFFISRQIILAIQSNYMQVQKAALQGVSSSLFQQNFKTNRNSIRKIDRYLLESSFEHQLMQNSNINQSTFSKKSQFQKGILNKSISRSQSSQFPEFKGFLFSNGLSKVQSCQDCLEQDYAGKIQKLQRQNEEQQTIIALQEELINKLMVRLQSPNHQQNNSNKQSNLSIESSLASKFERLCKVRQLLESSIQQL